MYACLEVVMERNTVRVSKKGWIVIPKALRERYGLHPGTRVALVEYAGTLALVPLPEDFLTSMRGFLKDGPSLTEALLEERRREFEREEARIRSWGQDDE
jgi:AbrB family looped-hinge helix DNA binding protein